MTLDKVEHDIFSESDKEEFEEGEE